MAAQKVTKKPARAAAATRTASNVFSKEEKAAMREVIRERQRSADANGEADVLAALVKKAAR